MRLPQVSFHDQDFSPTLQYCNRVLVILADIPRFLGIVSVLLRDPVTPTPTPLLPGGGEEYNWGESQCLQRERKGNQWSQTQYKGD